MNPKHEWRKIEKQFYLPKAHPELATIPEFQFLTIAGKGNPNNPLFAECVAVLYALSYAIKMYPKKLDVKPDGYFDYTVYPLEGVWDISDEAKEKFTGKINKDDLVYNLMIRQPDFVQKQFIQEMLEWVKKKKPELPTERIRYEKGSEGTVVQMLHVGSFDNEAETFAIMEEFATKNGLTRTSKVHREIYLSDFRKISEDKLKTVLRFRVKKA